MTTRQRSTWSKPGSDAAPRQAATSRRADIYTMNQEHPQPSVVEYENGDPDSWAETPTTNKNVEMDYEGDHVKRNEVGFGEIRKDTFDHKDSKEWGGSGKYDNSREAATRRKANYALELSRELLRTDDQPALMSQASELMALPARHIASALNRIQALSPDKLPHDRKVRRATACCKLASRILGDGVGEDDIVRLAHVVMTIDDPTLKTILKMAAQVKVAQDEDDKPEGQQAQEDKSDQAQGQQAQQEKDDKPEAQQAQDQEQDEQGQQAQFPPAQAQEQCMSNEDMQALDQMLAEETGCIPPVPGMPPAPGPAPELTTIFAPPAAPPAMAAQAAPVAAAEISFDEEDGEEAHVAGSEELDSLFDEHPEVRAQREISASQQAVLAAQGGYGPAPAMRTASASAKKIGHVQAAPAARRTDDDELGALWERPAV